jgi:two-component system, NarL family, sensor kinase
MHAQQSDSIRVSHLFNEVTSGLRSYEAIQGELRALENRLTPLQTHNWIRYSESRYLLLSGRPKESMAMTLQSLFFLKWFHPEVHRIKFYQLLASAYGFGQNYENAIHYFKRALELAERHGLTKEEAYIRNNIANIFFGLLEYEQVYAYALQAVEILSKLENDPYYPAVLGILSIAEVKLNKMDDALAHAREAERLAENPLNPLAQILSSHALGELAYAQGQLEDAERHYLRSLALSRKYGQRQFELFNSIGLLTITLESREFNQAVEHGIEALKLAELTKNYSTLYSIYRKLAKAYAGIENNLLAYTYLNRAHDLFLETNEKETKKAVNDLLIQYDTEKKEKDIASMKLELLSKEVESVRLWNTLGIVAFSLITLVLFFIAYRLKIQQRIQQFKLTRHADQLRAAMLSEERERKRVGRELHDGIASQLVGIKYRIETDQSMAPDTKEFLHKLLSQAHQDIRQIAHNLSPESLHLSAFENFLSEYAQAQSNSTVTIYYTHLGHPLPPMQTQLKLVVFRIIQELVQNAIKHANPTHIYVQSSVNSEELAIRVENDGSGFNPEESKRGNGLQSINERIEFLGGTFSLDSHPMSNGTVAYFFVPLSRL